MEPNLDRRRALLVLDKIDEILVWEKTKERERDVRFVELGQYLCEVRAGQYGRLENLKSFDDFLEKRFPESRRKAYYLMAIHENLTKIPKQQLREIGWSKATELVKVARKDGEQFDCATWLHKAKELPKEGFKGEVERHLTGKEIEPGRSGRACSRLGAAPYCSTGVSRPIVILEPTTATVYGAHCPNSHVCALAN